MNIDKTEENQIRIRHIESDDYRSWSDLYLKYAEFYKVPFTEEMLTQLWNWLVDPNSNIYCLVATIDSKVVGFAHYRTFIRPLTASVAIFMDDLFVSESHRNHGVGKELIDRIESLAQQKGYSLIRWITAKDNIPAKNLYDKVAKETTWITYDLNVEPI